MAPIDTIKGPRSPGYRIAFSGGAAHHGSQTASHLLANCAAWTMTHVSQLFVPRFYSFLSLSGSSSSRQNCIVIKPKFGAIAWSWFILQFYVQLAVCELLIHLIHGSCVNIVSFCSKRVVQVISDFVCPIFDGLVQLVIIDAVVQSCVEQCW